MSEKRKPYFVMLLRYPGNKAKKDSHKIEAFQAIHWLDNKRMCDRNHKRYRLRVNGKWIPEGKIIFYNKWQFRDILFRSILKEVKMPLPNPTSNKE